jgi:hypothetical protein
MPAGVSAYVPLANLTLSANQASVSITSISGSYRDLILVINAGITTAGNSGINRINGDTGSNYFRVTMAGNGTSATSSTSTMTNFGNFWDGAWPQTITAQSIIQFMDYSATDKHKTILIRSNNAANTTEAHAYRWANTAAITSLSLAAQFGTDLWLAGSTFALYGVSA